MSETQNPFVHDIADDHRPICRLVGFDRERLYEVGVDGVTAIRVYDDGIGLPFYAIEQGEHLAARVPVHHCIVVYQPPSPDPQP